jgi:hypothetical protein
VFPLRFCGGGRSPLGAVSNYSPMAAGGWKPSLVRRRIQRASSGQHRHRKPLDALRQVGQEPQRVPINPLASVDQHQHRAPVGEIHHQPVQAVPSLEAGISAGRLPLVRSEQARCGSSRTREQIGVR